MKKRNCYLPSTMNRTTNPTKIIRIRSIRPDSLHINNFQIIVLSMSTEPDSEGDINTQIENNEELKSHVELEARDKNRLETFVDGVFAIAITLLVLDFVIPSLSHSNVTLINYLVSLIPKFIGYFLAFYLLGMLLNAHSRQFTNTKYADQTLWWINIVFLSFVVLVPFVTSIWTIYGDTTIGVWFFHFDMLISGSILCFNWYYLKNHKYLLIKNLTSRTSTIITYRNYSIPLASIIAIVIAFVSPVLSNVAYVLILVIMIIAPTIVKKEKLNNKSVFYDNNVESDQISTEHRTIIY